MEPLILDTVNAAPRGHYCYAAQSGTYNGDNPRPWLPILSGLTFSTVAVLAGLIVWASLA